MLRLRSVLAALMLSLAACAFAAGELTSGIDSLYKLSDEPTKQVNALWTENPKEMQFGEGRTKVTVANLKGPGIITMVHFALPNIMKLNRELIVRMYWDGEKTPSVEAPFVDFFCDPNGSLERIDSALVNKNRGWNCYFPMPFARSARIELEYDNSRFKGDPRSRCPCYSYVHYKQVKSLPKTAGYFHAHWRQEKILLGKKEYRVFEASGKGQFIGWNVTIRSTTSPIGGYLVDENVRFYIDGEHEPSIDWQGIEDAFGFSWGFPEKANSFPNMGYQPYYGTGAAMYRFMVSDPITFQKSMRMTVGPGKNEPAYIGLLSNPEYMVELSSVGYWYQTEPHKSFELLPSRAARMPVFLGPSDRSHEPGETLVVNCASAEAEDYFLKKGWDYVLKRGFQFASFPTKINHCWADYDSLEFEITCPKGAAGTLRMYILDGDNYCGGRKQSIAVEDRMIGEYENFQEGKWVEASVSSDDTADGHISIVMKNLKATGGNAVVSILRFVEQAK